MRIMNRIPLLVVLLLIALPAWATERITIPSGTALVVRTNDAINSKTAEPGSKYSGVLDIDVVDSSDAVAIPKGSDVESAIQRLTKDSEDMVLAVDSVMVNGRRHEVSTEPVEEKGKQGVGKNKRTGKFLGGGAALGAVVGAIAGGGKGAAIGAASGAAAGAGAQTLTKGKAIKIPAETVLTFRLQQPLHIRGTEQ